MFRVHLAALVTLAVVQQFLIAGDTETAKAEVVGVQIRKPIPKPILNRERFDEPGTTVELLLRRPGVHIVGLDRINITALRDDKNNDLIGKQDLAQSLGAPMIPDDGSSILLEIKCKRLPAQGVAKLRLKGEIVLRIASGRPSVIKQKIASLKEGEQLEIGPFVLDRYYEKEGEHPFVSNFYASRIIKTIEFLDGNEKSIPFNWGTSGWGLSGFQVTYNDVYFFMNGVTPTTVRITYYTKWDTLAVPINIEFSIGL